MKHQSTPKTTRSAFLDAMSRVASTVSIVTTDGPAGRAGATVSSLVSVSADSPSPIVLVCLHRNSRTASAVSGNGVFCVNSLGVHQVVAAELFAGQPTAGGPLKFEGIDWEAATTGAPRLIDAPLSFDCRVVNSIRVGSHDVIFGAVEDLTFGRDMPPLIHVNRSYAATATTDLLEPRSAA